ncbi:MAG: DUF2934 domain-containing protein [Gammaproteobacteria bacterium]|nr:DUF2934 domain-containing protein [Gammaproteobacteria bacterium]NBT43422.1 DUF2934 domain-containing protein [Gammaproteobacteria bacterium]NBY22174.1 DUF2934 domain-containing protein [Gammaproteobacteria bacterium]NDE34340.1 DUF2934 domain-containing protein [Gammaproteobacteria bacterium]NDE56295.1 DUF2934 domain-containing protein [Gammaproteobacteria bacterium]
MAKSTDVKSTEKRAAAKAKTPAEAKPAKASKSTPATSPKTPAPIKASKATKAAATPKPKKSTLSKAPQPGQDMINGMVAVAAYFLAEKRQFAPGFEEQDWLAAKAQIMAQLAEAKNPLK